MQRGRPGFLGPRHDEIQSVNFAPLASKHHHESRTANPIGQSALLKQKTGVPTLSIFFVTLNSAVCLNPAMSLDLKACARGLLTFVQIIIVVAFIVSLAVIAALSCLATRKRNGPAKFLMCCSINSAIITRLDRAIIG